jgi:hypothetical protein
MVDNRFRKIELVKPGILTSIFRECHRPAALIPDADVLFFYFIAFLFSPVRFFRRFELITDSPFSPSIFVQ